MMVKTAAVATAKYGPSPAAGAIVAAGLGDFNVWMIAAGGLGLLFGAMWRASYLREQNKATWQMVGSDFLNSLMAGGANAAITFGIIDYFDASVLASLAIGSVIGATGVRALLWAQKFAIGYLEQKFSGSSKNTLDGPGS